MHDGEYDWTPEDAEDGVVPHTAVFDPMRDIYREIIGDDEGDAWQESVPVAVPAWPRYAGEES